MMRKWWGSYLAVLGLLFAIEAGLRMRSWLDNRFANAIVRNGGLKAKVLLIGDSILGLPDLQNTIAAELSDQLEHQSPDRFLLRNLDAPANTTNRVHLRVSEYLERERPAVVVLMLGKSDSQWGREAESRPTWFDQIRIVRLFQLAVARTRAEFVNLDFAASLIVHKSQVTASPSQEFNQAVDHFTQLESQKKFDQMWTELDEFDQKLAADPGLLCYLHAQRAALATLLNLRQATEYQNTAIGCAERLHQLSFNSSVVSSIYSMIGASYKNENDYNHTREYFIKAQQQDPGLSRPHEDLAWFYANHADCKSAIPLFETALRLGSPWRSTIIELNKCYVKEGRNSEGEAFFGQLAKSSYEGGLLRLFQSLLIERSVGNLQAHVRRLIRRLGSEPENHAEYISHLWAYKILHDSTRANALFLESSQTKTKQTEPLNADLFQEIVQQVLTQNVKLLILQYPNEIEKNVLAATGPWRDHIQFLSLRKVLAENIGKYDVFDLFEDDFEHLSPIGAKICAEAIAKELLNIEGT